MVSAGRMVCFGRAAGLWPLVRLLPHVAQFQDFPSSFSRAFGTQSATKRGLERVGRLLGGNPERATGG